MVLGFIGIVLTLLLVVGIHEWGHFLAARFYNVKIKRISIGFGRPLLKYHSRKGIEWVWAILPLGGYVHLLNSRIEPVNDKELPFAFDKKPIYQRIIILLAGAFANFLAAFIFLTLMYFLGFTQRMPQIATVEPASIAANAGIKEGDRILAINGFPTHSWQEVGMRLIEFFGKSKVILDVENKNEQRVLLLNLNQWHFKKGKANLLSSLGLSADKSDATKEAVPGRNLIKASYLALHKINDLLHFYLIMLKQIITAKIPFFVLLGPLGLFAVSANSFMQGLAVFLSFIASFSIAVGLVNLFPIPGLDGGLIVYALLEKIRKKPISVAMEILLHQLVSILAVILLIQLVLNDLTRGIN